MVYINTIHLKSGKTKTVESDENLCNTFAKSKMEKDSSISTSNDGDVEINTWIPLENIEFVETLVRGE